MHVGTVCPLSMIKSNPVCSYSICPLPRWDGYSPLPLQESSFSRRILGKSTCARVPNSEFMIPLAVWYLCSLHFVYC